MIFSVCIDDSPGRTGRTSDQSNLPQIRDAASPPYGPGAGFATSSRAVHNGSGQANASGAVRLAAKLLSRRRGGGVSARPDRDVAGHGRLPSGQADGQDPVACLGLGRIEIDIVGDHDLAMERAEPPLPDLELRL